MFFPIWFGGKGRVVSVPPQESFLLQEDLFLILQEDSGRIIIESGSALEGFLLQEDLSFILQENGSRLIIQ